MKLTAQIIGILACISIVYSFQCRKNKYLFLFQGIGAVGFAVNYIMLGSLSSGFMNIAAVIRMSILYNGEKLKKRWVYFGLQALFILLTMLSLYMSLADGFGSKTELLKIISTSTMVMAAMLVSTYVMWGNDGNIIRKAQFFFPNAYYINSVHNVTYLKYSLVYTAALSLILFLFYLKSSNFALNIH